jgi:hypothetical protein
MTSMFYIISVDDGAYDLFVEAENARQAYETWVRWIKSMEDGSYDVDLDSYRVMPVPALTGENHHLEWYKDIKPVKLNGEPI